MKNPEQPAQARPYHAAVSYATRLVRTGVALAIMGALGWLGGCSDSSGPVCCDPPQGLVVSDPVPAAGIASGAGAAAAPVSSAGDDVAYVSLPPGTAPTGSTATIRRVGDAGSIVATVVDGGFDPLPVGAAPGDVIEVIVTDAARATVLQARLAVAATRPPIVVRTDPPRKKTDVPLNSAIVIVFSEPVASGTLTSSSVQLLRGTTPVAGTVRLLQGSGTAAAFVPATPLDPNTEYRLEVTRTVRDLEGDALESGVTVEFTTGQSSTGAAASLMVSPDTVTIMTGATYQMTATVRDAAGSELVDQPVTWSTSNASGLAVSPTGLLTALAAGSYAVTATVNGLTASAGVTVLFTPGPPASLTVSPATPTVAVFDTILLTATVRDVAGNAVFCPSVTWTSSAPTVATTTINPCAEIGPGNWLANTAVLGVRPGSVTITAASGTARGTASVTVVAAVPVASVTVTPAATTLAVQATRQLSATLRDANGRVIGGRPIAWRSDNAAVATVDGSGLVAGVSPGAASVTATSEGVSDTAAITVTAPITFASMTASGTETCGLTPTGKAYCWGLNSLGTLGTGSRTGPEQCGGNQCSRIPVAVTGGLTFSALSGTCGLTTNGQAYCWGYSLGDGSDTSSSVPVAVAGGLTFSSLTTGSHTCGLTPTGAAYCWGNNNYGELGDGSTIKRLVPVAVTGGLTFSAVSAGNNHTCGVTTNGEAYCWGANGAGQLGNGSFGLESSSSAPVAVTGGLTFSSVSAGYSLNTCGLTTTGAAYCWGNYDNNFQFSPVPVAVIGGLTFSALTAGGGPTTCALTAGGSAYCWGLNQRGQRGDGTYNEGGFPTAVAGGLTFSALSAGFYDTCGITVAGLAYCWGENTFGQLGDGSTTGSNVPVKVAGPP